MKILIDIGHPAHVHLFKHFAWEMQKKGHEILFTTREKEFAVYLLKKYGFRFQSFGKHYKTTYGKIYGLVKFDIKLLFCALNFRPEIFLSHGSMYAAHVAWLLRKPHIALEDTGNVEQVKLYKPFTKVILTPSSFHRNYGDKQINYQGYHELAYLHPQRFKPDSEICQLLGVKPDEKFVLLRFVSWNASHDKGQSGLSLADKQYLVQVLSKHCKVFISSEGILPDSLESYRLKTYPDKIHDVLAKSSLFVGEGATMASECAVLGTPAVYINSLSAGTITEQEKYGLLFHFKTSVGVLNRAINILSDSNSKNEFEKNRLIILKDKIDLTGFLVWFIEKYPESITEMKLNPDHQFKFQ